MGAKPEVHSVEVEPDFQSTPPTPDDGPPFAAPRRRPRFQGLWRHPDFLRLWAAQTTSQLGSHITLLALPLVAVLTLDASAFEVGLLAAAQWTPFLVVSLFSGVWIDRMRRRPILIVMDFGRAGLLLLIPVASTLGVLRLEVLYAVAVMLRVLAVFFDVAYLSYVPALVRRDQLVAANSRLQGSESAAQVIGPGVAGGLVSLVTAALALAVDAVTYLASGIWLLRIRTSEPPVPPRTDASRLWSDIGDGLRLVGRHATLRALAGCSATTSLFAYAFFAVYVLFMSRELGLGPGAIGAVFAVGGGGALIGAVAAGPVARRFGQGRTMVVAQMLFGLTGAGIPLAVLFPDVALAMVIASEFLQWATVVVYDVNQLSLRQSLTPDRMQGRVNATFRFLVWGMRPIGSLLGGVLGGLIGLPLTLVVGEIGMVFAVVWLFASPLWGRE